MFKNLLIIYLLILITACAGSIKNDELLATAVSEYQSTSNVVAKAKSYNLDVSDADKHLSEAKELLNTNNPVESIVSSKKASSLALTAIQQHEKKQAEQLPKTEEDKRAMQEADRSEKETRRRTAEGKSMLSEWEIISGLSLVQVKY